jgi:hypothetical protein
MTFAHLGPLTSSFLSERSQVRILPGALGISGESGADSCKIPFSRGAYCRVIGPRPLQLQLQADFRDECSAAALLDGAQ